ncbi:MAG TPA: glycosyltransferase family 4 protein [Allosphingosinicella sp.]|jgi:glycosyltransferase involved in cell wall biosynthesis|nr:glycosyltransferase family 4 protein [Allosphingosinicella sp.]
MSARTVVISINASWNILNFRLAIVRSLQEAGWRVVALAPEDKTSEKLVALGVGYEPIVMDKKGISPLQDLLLLFRYWKALGRIRPEVALFYTAKPNIYGSLAAHLRGIKVINNVSGLGTAFIKKGLLTRIVSLLYRIAFGRSSTVFFQNSEDRDLFVAEGIVKLAKTRLLPGSGVDLDRFAPPAAPGGRRREGFVFLLIGRILRDKGVYEYVEAARLVRLSHPEAEFRLLGFLDAENRTAIPREEVQRWIDEGLVTYLGEAEDVRPFIAAADCVVLPSYREGLPRTLLEAAAMAKPLIASDVPGCRHVVEPGVNGLLCKARDAGALADAMCAMIRASAAHRERWGLAGRAMVERKFDERVVADLYRGAIADALA